MEQNRNMFARSMGMALAGLLFLLVLTPVCSVAAEDTYFSGDNITVHLLLDASKNAPAKLELMIYDPQNDPVVNSTKDFTLTAGENQINHTVAFVTGMDGLHYIRYDIYADLDGGWTLVQSSSQYFDGQVNDAPLVDIISPDADGSYTTDEEILFSANVSDPEGQDVSILWSSNVSGTIGNTTSFNESLAEGIHNITLTAEDEMGAVSYQSVVINVTQDSDQNNPSAGGSGGSGSKATVSDPSEENEGEGEGEAGPADEDGNVDGPDEDTGEEDDEGQNVDDGTGEEDQEEKGFLPGFEATLLIMVLLLVTYLRRRIV